MDIIIPSQNLMFINLKLILLNAFPSLFSIYSICLVISFLNQLTFQLYFVLHPKLPSPQNKTYYLESGTLKLNLLEKKKLTFPKNVI